MTIHQERPCHSTNYRKGRTGVKEYYLVLHYVGALGGAAANARYYGSTPNLGASAHYFVDHAPGAETWSSVPETDTAFHCGAAKYVHPTCRNNNSIGVELCCHQDAAGRWYFDPETVDSAVELCRDIVGRYGIPKERVLRHYDVTGKKCPAPFVEDNRAWEDFKNRIFEEESPMNKCIATIPLAEVERIAVVFAGGKTLAQVKKDQGCDYIINGGLYDSRGPVCQLKVDGVVKHKDPWGYIGYGWDQGPDLRLLRVPEEGGQVRNYIACVHLLGHGLAAGDKLSYDKPLGNERGRTAMAIIGDNLILYCTKDGSSYAATPETLQKEFAGMGVTSALMLDSGGSSQCDFGNGQTVTSSRKVNNYICVWTKKKEEKPVGKYKVTTSKDPLTIREGPGGTAVGSYPKDTVVEVLEIVGNWARTVSGWCSMTYLTPVAEPPIQPTPPPMGDVPDDWAEEAWAWAKAKGLMDGTRPRDNITLQELAVVLKRMAQA